MGTSSLTLTQLSSTTAALWQGSVPILIAGFTIAVAFFMIFALVRVIQRSARKTLR